MEKWPSRNPWGGNYIYRADTAQTFTATAVNERYVTATQVASSSAAKLDTNIDDGANGTGTLRYTNAAGALPINMEISDDTY